MTSNRIVESAPSDAAGPALAITNVSVLAGTGSGRTIRIDGAGFATFRAIVEINGVQINTVTFLAANRDENGTTNRIEINDPTGNLIPVGALVKIDVLNPGLMPGSGQRSPIFDFRRLSDQPTPRVGTARLPISSVSSNRR
ncbi:MAG TPA: hypothetical protein VFC63_00815 [Blastocatellia bacterium]|nr:hypothetical protein [Blastocatellia bacterium]